MADHQPRVKNRLTARAGRYLLPLWSFCPSFLCRPATSLRSAFSRWFSFAILSARGGVGFVFCAGPLLFCAMNFSRWGGLGVILHDYHEDRRDSLASFRAFTQNGASNKQTAYMSSRCVLDAPGTRILIFLTSPSRERCIFASSFLSGFANTSGNTPRAGFGARARQESARGHRLLIWAACGGPPVCASETCQSLKVARLRRTTGHANQIDSMNRVRQMIMPEKRSPSNL